MNEQDYTTTITVDQGADDVFAAVTNVRGWWSEEIVGDTERLGDEFVFEVPGTHYSKIKLTEVIPGKRVVWHVVDARIEFVADKDEWTDTDIVFDVSARNGTTELTFTHIGLSPAGECYDVCTDAWGSYIRGSLHGLITTGTGYPYRKNGTFETEVQKHEEFSAGTAR